MKSKNKLLPPCRSQCKYQALTTFVSSIATDAPWAVCFPHTVPGMKEPVFTAGGTFCWPTASPKENRIHQAAGWDSQRTHCKSALQLKQLF